MSISFGRQCKTGIADFKGIPYMGIIGSGMN